MTATALDQDARYRAVQSRDRRFDGMFYTGVTSTGIYCRPSCPARTPAAANVEFHPSAAAAQAAGFRACKRCVPDATPGSPAWDVAADVAGRAMRLVNDGVVDREGVPGLARRLGYTPRHLTRLLTRELGAGPLALARARRAQTARVLIDSTDLGFADVAFAAGFSSVRQFNDTVREVYALSPTELRGRRSRRAASAGSVRLRLAVRTPFHGSSLLRFLAARTLPGVEAAGDGWYARTLTLPHAPGAVRIELPDLAEPGTTAMLTAEFCLADLRDITAAVERVRRLLDADCDPVAVGSALGADPLLGDLVHRWPGLRVPGHVDGAEVAVRAIVGQQISVAGARTVLTRLAHQYGERLDLPGAPAGLSLLFPRPEALAAVSPEALPMPRSRGRALLAVCSVLAGGSLALDRSAERPLIRQALLAIPGIGPWTADYIALRALGDPDVFLANDLGTRAALRSLSREPGSAATLAAGWRPWRSYAQALLWQSILPAAGPPGSEPPPAVTTRKDR